MKEKDVVRQIREYLDLLSARGDLYYARISTTGIPLARGGFRPNSATGLPDFMIWIKGVWIGVEAKAPRGKLSESQEIFCAAMDRFGHQYYVVYHVDDVIRLLRQNGIRP